MHRVAGSMRLITQLDSLVDARQTDLELLAAYFPREGSERRQGN